MPVSKEAPKSSGVPFSSFFKIDIIFRKEDKCLFCKLNLTFQICLLLTTLWYCLTLTLTPVAAIHSSQAIMHKWCDCLNSYCIWHTLRNEGTF
jgi:hypothetical protein